ncbi:MAG: hypothetical protein OHK93_005407 [Ramalina farinacea]|uniref:Uncharacterized protein n=1 Tax=Ramalina farinacea TaxID=258253 RepID=A0AA43TP55_9LECA|nr:hypothetical protein [Ramalina farinacea]
MPPRHPTLRPYPEDSYVGLVRAVVSERKLAKLVNHITLHRRVWRNRGIVLKSWNANYHFSGALPGFLVSRRQRHTESKTPKQILEWAIRQSDYILNDEVNYWLEQIGNNTEDLVFALLFLHLPALRTLDLLAPAERICSYLVHVVEHIASRSTRHALLEPADMVAPWQNLRKVSITFSPIHSEPLRLLGAFISLPSLLTLEATKVFIIGNEYVTGSATPARISTVERLQSSASFFPVEALCDLLRVTKTLKEFTYVIEPSMRLHDDDRMIVYDASRVVSALSQTSGATLETLRISATRTVKWQTVKSFQGFSRLSLIQMSTNILIAPSETNAKTVAAMLPKSLRCLVLQWDQGAPVEDVGSFHTFLQGLAQNARNQLPLLTKICIPTTFEQEHWDHLLKVNKPLWYGG